MAVLTCMYMMADTIIAGIAFGEKAATGVNLVMPIISLSSFFSVIFSLGVPILYANETGAFRREEADRIFHVGIMLTVLTGVVLFLILYLFGDIYLKHHRPDQMVLSYAGNYLVWIRLAALIMPLDYLLEGMVFADGDEGINTAASIVSGAGKILFSILLCKRFGTLGLGAATFISIGLSFLILLLHFARKTNTLRPGFAFSLSMTGSIIRYSMVDASTYLFIAIFTALLNHYVAGTFGARVLIIVSAINLVKESQLIFDGIGEAITPIISVYLGEETYPGVREVWKLAGWTALVESLVVSLFIIITAPVIVRSLGIEDQVLAGQIVTGIRMMAVTLFFSCRMFLDAACYILMDKISLGVLVCACRDLLFSAPMAVIGGTVGGIDGVFAGLMIAPVLAYAASFLYVRIRYGRENYPLFLAGKENEKKLKFYEFEVRPETIVHVRNQIGDMLTENRYSKRLINRVMLLFEELFMTIYEKNEGKTVLAECSVEMGRGIRLITKDDGVIMNLTDMDRKVESLRNYIVSSLITTMTTRRAHFLALSYNRNVFEIGDEVV